jgi:2-amino-4-hydroxy-6-hydroxymethyldihydropteridine diphosphokinase
MEILVGLGGNVGDVRLAFAKAMRGLARHCSGVTSSGLWRTAPVGPEQAEYLNAAILLEWPRHPLELLAISMRLELEAGRSRRLEERWGPRPLDLDLLLAPGLVTRGPALVLPHPRLHERRFALLPAAELAPAWVHPRELRTLAALAMALDPASQPCTRLGAFPCG